MPPTPDSETAPAAAIAFIGGGNMARALIGGLRRSGVPADRISASEPNPELRAALSRDFGIVVNADNATTVRDADVIVLAVKPQILPEVCAGLRDAVRRDPAPLLVSIAAGMPTRRIAHAFGIELPIVRAMPNIGALVGAGASGLFANPLVDASQRSTAEAILAATGVAVWIDDEALMDTVTALSGSGPAYYFLLTEALEDAAVAQGLPRDTARRLAAATCHGAGELLAGSMETAGELRRRVTSPGGTTAAALAAFADGGFKPLVARALAASRDRGRELAGGDARPA